MNHKMNGTNFSISNTPVSIFTQDMWICGYVGDINSSFFFDAPPSPPSALFDTDNEEASVRWGSLLLAAFMILGAAGNSMVCIAIFTDRRLQNVTNYFLFSLAVADLLVSLLVMPFSILTEFYDGYWQYGFTLCAGHTYADVFLCSASIVHMSIISLDRYLGISQPLKTRNKSKLVVTLKIIIVWVITTMISCPIAILAIISPSDIYKDNVCAIDNPYFMIYGSTLAFLIPCLIMAATYVRTTQLLRQQALLCSSRTSSCRSEGGTPALGLRRTRTRRGNSKRDSARRRQNSFDSPRSVPPSLGSLTDNGYQRPSLRRCVTSRAMDLNDLKNSAIAHQIEMQANGRLKAIDPASIITRKTRTSRSSDESYDATAAMMENGGVSPTRIKSFRNKVRERTITFFKTTKRSSTASELANEQKATRVLGLVFGCFVVCWTPFFVQNFTMAFCGHFCQMPHWLMTVFLWLGYLSSTINPVIYTTFNKRFRQAFANIVRCRCCCSAASKTRHRSSASSFFSANNNTYHHGSITSGHVTCPSPSQIVDAYPRCNINRTPPDLIAANAIEAERFSLTQKYYE